MDLASETINPEIHLAGNLKYVQFTSALSNFVEREILADGWQSSAEAFGKIIPKQRYLSSFNKALNRAILSGFEDSMKEMFDSVDLPKQWDILYQENCDTLKNDSYGKMCLLNMKIKYRNMLKSVIEAKLQRIEEIKQLLCLQKLAVTKKSIELEAVKEKWKKNCVVLENLNSMNF